MGQFVLLQISQQSDFSQQFEPRVLGVALGQAANQLPAFIQLAAAGQDGCTPGLRLHHVGRVLDLVDPGFSTCKILALFGDLRQRQISLGQAAVGLVVFAFLAGRQVQGHIPFKGDLRLRQLVVLQLQRAQHQPGGRKARLVLDHGLQFCGRLAKAHRVQQAACVSHADLGNRFRVAGKVFFHHGFCSRQLGAHQFKRHQRGAFSLCVGCLAFLGGIQRAISIASGQAHAADRRPCRRCSAGVNDVRAQRVFNHRRGQLLVADAGISCGNGGYGQRAVGDGGQFDALLQGLQRVLNPVQGNQDLKHIAVGVPVGGLGLPPGQCSLQCSITRTRLHGNFYGSLIQLAIVGFAGGVEYQRIACAGIAFAGGDFTNQQTVKELCVQGRVVLRRGLLAFGELADRGCGGCVGRCIALGPKRRPGKAQTAKSPDE